MQRSLREDLALRGYDLVFEFSGSTIAINTKEFTSEKEEAVYQKYGLKTLRGKGITLYNPEVWRAFDGYILELISDCLAPEQPFFAVAPYLALEGVKDLRHWDLESATDLSWMFYKCFDLGSLLLDGWDVSSVTNLYSMFSGCESLEKLSLNGWDVSRAKDMSWMFSDCMDLEKLSLDGWDVLSVTTMRGMFSYCKSLKNLSLNGWCISEDTDTDFMFENCPAGISVESLIGSRTTPCSVF